MLDISFIKHLKNIVYETGQFILQESKQFHSFKIQNKSAYDLVSYVDIESEKRLMEKLSKLLPEAGFIAEETHPHSQNEWNWIIDPLDGTTNFTRQLPSYAISVALAHNTDIHAGVVLNIPLNEMFHAQKNSGAFLNNTKIEVSKNQTLAQSLIATGFSVSQFDKINTHLNVVKNIITHSLGIRRMGAAAVDLCYVACGRFDGFFEWYLNPWDVAAGALIAQEAGAIVSDFSKQNNYLFGKEIIAAQPDIYNQLITYIQTISS